MNASAVRRHGRARRGAWMLVCASFCAAAATAGFAARAASVDWSGNRFVYATNGSRLADVLRVFAAGQHVPLRLSGPVEGVVSGRFAMPPPQFLDTLCATYGLVWYYDGAVLQVSASRAQQRLAIRPNYLTPQALSAALQDVGAVDAHFPLQVDAAAATFDVHGPAGYVTRVRETAARLEADARERTHTSVRLFRLQVATAADQTREIDGQRVVVPGVATLLRQRVHGGAGDAAHTAQTAYAAAPLEFDAPLPVIEADATTNSILIRDRPEHIDGDGVLVADADVPPELVSLQTWVVDVAADALPGLQAALPQALTTGHATVAEDGARALLAELGELEQTHRARLEVSRTAFTFDRAPAVFDRHEARMLAHETDTDDGVDLWLSVAPTLEGSAALRRVSLRVEWGHPGDAAGGSEGEDTPGVSNAPNAPDAANAPGTTATVAPGQGLVVLGGGAGPAMRRVIVVVPTPLA